MAHPEGDRQKGLLDRVTVVNDDGERTLSPQVMPAVAIAVLSVVVLLTVGYCAAGLIPASDEEPAARPPATPSFVVAPPSGCGPVDPLVVETIDEEMSTPRLSVGRAVQQERDDGVLTVGVTIRRDDGAIEAVAAIFAVDLTGKVLAISAEARTLTRLPDGRKTVAMSPVSSGAQLVNSCLRD
ncbi:hypothetical protein [Dietzia sp. 179-F 9C3 NHS]|uniref:hypothetical protein n=1 Tax=Dietzia sp. 179-F 9C3 NHS TaxID=3374295 RepID=UPI003879C692